MFDEKCDLSTFPSKFSFWDRISYLRLKRPSWIRAVRQDPLGLLYDNLGKLLNHGIVTWGSIIQVNQKLFESGSDDLPGEVVYSLVDQKSISVRELEGVANLLYKLKGQDSDNLQLSPIVDYLSDEYVRVFGLQVPDAISPSLKCRISTTMFIRKHLPNQRIASNTFPLIVLPTDPYVVLPLPDKYWPSHFLNRILTHQEMEGISKFG